MMDVVEGIRALPLGRGPSVVTIGMFDGVHLGHQAVLNRTVEEAGRRELPAVAVTFDPHPREVLTPGRVPPLITTPGRKAAAIEALGVQTLVVLEFDDELSRLPSEGFARRVIAEGLEAVHVVVGANFTFGHQALGTVRTLEEVGRRLGFDAEGVALIDLDGRRISSSSIREAAANGDLSWPTLALGRRFVVDGRVVRGAGRGGPMGFPTANLEVPGKMLLPGRGIYAGRAIAGGRPHAAAIDVGTNPQFGAEPLHVEAHLLDFEGDLTGRDLSVEFWERLRDEERFDSVDDLVRQMAADVERTRSLVDERD